MDRRKLLALPLLLAAVTLLAGLARTGAAEPALSEISGTVTGYDPDSDLFNVNTRLGPKLFLVTDDTEVTLNNRTTTMNQLMTGDLVTVEYRFDTSVVYTVDATREERARGRIVTVTNNAITVRSSGENLALRPDAQSRVELQGIPLQDRSVLNRLDAVGIYQPGSLLLLSLNASASDFSGRVGAVDSVNRTITVTGKKSRTFSVNPVATVRRNGEFVTLANVQPGDRVRVAFAKSGGERVVLAMKADG